MWVALMLAVWPLAGATQDFPALYNVTGVADDDVLAVRDAPDTDGEIVATLPPDSVGVEVLRLNDDGTWGWIGLPEGNGWAATAFLIRQETDVGRIPRPMRCLGNEPFWSIRLGSAGQDHATPEATTPLAMVSEAAADGGYLAFLHAPDGALYSVTIARQVCSDGMSNRDYGLAAHVFRQGEGGTSMLTGCCMLTAD